MFALENSYFDITSRFWRFCQMWYLGYHGFEAIIQLSTGRNGMQTFNMVRVHTDCLSTSQGIPPSCSSKPPQSWTFFRHFHAVPREQVRLEALHHMPKKARTCTIPKAPTVVLASSDEAETEDGITDEECSDMEIEYILKLERDIR